MATMLTTTKAVATNQLTGVVMALPVTRPAIIIILKRGTVRVGAMLALLITETKVADKMIMVQTRPVDVTKTNNMVKETRAIPEVMVILDIRTTEIGKARNMTGNATRALTKIATKTPALTGAVTGVPPTTSGITSRIEVVAITAGTMVTATNGAIIPSKTGRAATTSKVAMVLRVALITMSTAPLTKAGAPRVVAITRVAAIMARITTTTTIIVLRGKTGLLNIGAATTTMSTTIPVRGGVVVTKKTALTRAAKTGRKVTNLITGQAAPNTTHATQTSVGNGVYFAKTMNSL